MEGELPNAVIIYGMGVKATEKYQINQRKYYVIPYWQHTRQVLLERLVLSSLNSPWSWLVIKLLKRVSLIIMFVINDIKLKYLCRNKLPSIIFVLMYNNDYVINVSSIRLKVRCWLMERCRKRSNWVVVGCSMDLKHKVDDQTIVDNCKISRTKIGFVESVNGSFPG